MKEKEEPLLSWWEFIKAVLFLVSENRKKFLFLNAVVFASFFYDFVPPFIVGEIVDFFTNYEVGESLNQFYFYVIFIAVATSIIAFIRLSSKNELGKIISQTVYNVKVKGFDRLLDFSIKWHDKENTGNKIQKIQNGSISLSQLQRELGADIFVNASGMIGALIGFLILKPSFFIYCLVYLAIFIFIQIKFYKKFQQMNIEYNTRLEKASGTYYEGVSNLVTLKALGVKDDYKKNISSREELSRDTMIDMIKLGTSKWKYFQIINGIFLGGIVFLSGYGYLNGTVTLGSIFVFFNYFQRLSVSTGQSTNILDRLVAHKTSISRMMPIFWEETTAIEGDLRFPNKWNEINIENGNFAFKEKKALEDINIKIEKSEKIGIVGESGSGKSTLAKLLLALYEFDSGIYKIGDTKATEIKHSELTKNVTLVLQDSEMFNLSLKENITLMRRYDDKLFKKAIEIAQIEDLINNLPEKENTLIGEKGYRLSGGERQRIGIARAIYKNPQILILDEATSSLDSRTEARIQEGLDNKLEEKTVITIAHRISTLKNSDRIIVLENGKIVEEGNFKKLEEDNKSFFYSLYHSQK